MSSLMDRHVDRIVKLLSSLEKGDMRHKQLVTVWLGSGGTMTSLGGCLRWLKVKGYIRKKDPSVNTSPYELTDRGKRYLGGLKA